MQDFNEIIYNWAYAIYDLTNENKNLALVSNEAAEITRLLKKNKDYLYVLNSYDIDENEKYRLIDEAFSRYNFYLVNTLKLAAKQHVIKYIIVILTKFVELSNEKRNIKYGFVYTISPLPERELKRLEVKLSNELKANIHLTNEIDPKLIAGIKIKVDDYLIDNSIVNKLNDFKKVVENN